MQELTVSDLQVESLEDFLMREFSLFPRYHGDSLSGGQFWFLCHKIFDEEEDTILAIRRLINKRWSGVIIHARMVTMPKTDRERKPGVRTSYVWHRFCAEMLDAVMAVNGSKVKLAALLYHIGSVQVYLSEMPIAGE